ncbi:MAG TPA: hypothetical protein VHK64_05370, partial [Nocardioidaceae bacterium]|nr:hypothetical protein [Nocardioidaceae bacterium]
MHAQTCRHSGGRTASLEGKTDAIRTNIPNLLDNPPIPVQAKLAAAWTSFMFLYVYVDILAIYKPGVVDDILVGVVWEFDITQTWAITA